MSRGSFSIEDDTERPDAVPYFNWDAPVSNAEVRQVVRRAIAGDEV